MELEVGKFERIIFFVFANTEGATYCQYELDSIMYEAFNQMDEEGKERLLSGLVTRDMYSVIRKINQEELNKWIKTNPDVKNKYREYKLNKIID